MRKIRCPHCQANLKIGEYTRDPNLSIRCSACKNLLFATNAEDEKKIEVLYQKPTNSYSGTGSSGTNMRGGMYSMGD